MMTTPNPEIIRLENQIKKLVQQVIELEKRISFLERENSRRKQDVNTLARK